MDFFRLLASVMVVWGHSYIFAGQDTPNIAGFSPHYVGVTMFFMLSGYLIAGSWMADRHVRRYATKRFLRIWPPLAIVVVTTVFVLGPLVSTISVSEYFTDSRTWQYLVRNLVLLPKYDLPGVFLDNPAIGGVNGSLWTLPIEAICYVAVPLMFMHRTGPWLFAGLTVAAFTVAPIRNGLAGIGLAGAAGVMPFFAIGVLAFVCRLRIPQGKRLQFDLSYGLYLVSFPVGQTIVLMMPDIAPVPLMAGTLAASLPLALLLHIAVEKPLRRFKPRIGGGMPPALAQVSPLIVAKAEG